MKSALLLAVTAFLACLPFAGRSQETRPPAFEVVSVKSLGPNIQHGPGPGMILGLRYTPNGVSGNSQIFAMIQDAFALKSFQLAGPDWIHSEVYQIAARMPEATSRETAHRMLGTMLEERFGLRYHREMRDLPVYALTEAKGGTKLRPVDPEQAKDREVPTLAGPRKGILSSGGRGFYVATATTMNDFADWVGIPLDRPVIDQTGLSGHYFIELKWSPDDPMELVSAIERQFGLKLERRTLPYEMFVVDRVEKVPTEN